MLKQESGIEWWLLGHYATPVWHARFRWVYFDQNKHFFESVSNLLVHDFSNVCIDT